MTALPAPRDARSTEVESTLVIRSSEPERIADSIASLTTLAGFRLVGPRMEALEDVYLDLDHELESRRLALRVRTVNGSRLVAFKTDAGADPMERIEVEGDWSRPTLKRILGELAARGVRIPTVRRWSDADPLEVMKALGFEVAQWRDTERRALDVFPEGKPGRRLAEVAVDRVVFHLHVGDVVWREVEIESKGADRHQLESLSRELAELFGHDLQDWPYGKLATGKAIGAILSETEASRALVTNGMLSPAGLERIQVWLLTESVGASGGQG